MEVEERVRYLHTPKMKHQTVLKIVVEQRDDAQPRADNRHKQDLDLTSSQEHPLKNSPRTLDKQIVCS